MNPRRPSVAWRGRFDRSTEYFLPVSTRYGLGGWVFRSQDFANRGDHFKRPGIPAHPSPQAKRATLLAARLRYQLPPNLISAHPNKSILMIGERGAGKDKREAAIRVWDDREFCGRVPRHNCDPTLPPTSGGKARSLRASFRLPCQGRAMLIAARSRSRTQRKAPSSK